MKHIYYRMMRPAVSLKPYVNPGREFGHHEQKWQRRKLHQVKETAPDDKELNDHVLRISDMDMKAHLPAIAELLLKTDEGEAGHRLILSVMDRLAMSEASLQGHMLVRRYAEKLIRSKEEARLAIILRSDFFVSAAIEAIRGEKRSGQDVSKAMDLLEGLMEKQGGSRWEIVQFLAMESVKDRDACRFSRLLFCTDFEIRNEAMYWLDHDAEKADATILALAAKIALDEGMIDQRHIGPRLREIMGLNI